MFRGKPLFWHDHEQFTRPNLVINLLMRARASTMQRGLPTTFIGIETVLFYLQEAVDNVSNGEQWVPSSWVF